MFLICSYIHKMTQNLIEALKPSIYKPKTHPKTLTCILFICETTTFLKSIFSENPAWDGLRVFFLFFDNGEGP